MNRRTAILVVGALAMLSGTAAAQPNLIPNQPFGWVWPVVPRYTNDATSTSVPESSFLTGEGLNTYLNSAWRNIGNAASGSFHNNTVLDGERILVDRTCPSLAPGASSYGINGGPFAVPGGRHTLELRVDSGGVVAESDETDNRIARQWAWVGGFLPPELYAVCPAPPDPQGGWSAIPAGQQKFDNCDGLRFDTGSGWDVLYAWAFGAGVDYDMRLYEPCANPSNGYSSPLATSTRRGRGVEAAIVNAHNVGSHTYEVGVTRYAGASDYYCAHVPSQPLAWGDSITVTFGQNEMLKLFDVAVPAGGVGSVSAYLQLATTDPSVVLMWADRTFTTGSLTDLTANTATDTAGRARLDVTAGAVGNYAVIVFRDPDWGTGPRSFGLRVTNARPDLVSYAPAGWHSPLVPRPTPDGTPSSVGLPTSLPAYTLGPYVNWTLRNSGGAACPITSSALVEIDDVPMVIEATSALARNANHYNNPTYSLPAVRAGRHTLSLHANHTGAFPEISNDNNAYGEQYFWTPVTEASLGDMGWDPVPPPATAGWEDVAVGSGETFWYNCNGWRLPYAPGNVWWQGFIIAPMPGDDYDLRLYGARAGVKDGFGEPLAGSGWGSNQTDYVLANLNVAPRQLFDVGVVKMHGTQSYRQQYVESATLGNAGALTLAPFTGQTWDMMQLREWYFTPGNWIFHLTNLNSGDRCGMTLHPADLAYQGKLVSTSSYPPDGGDVWLQVMVPAAGWYCLAVWVQEYAPTGMHYQLSMSPGGTPVPGDGGIPAATALAGVSPNPFNPKTTIAFDLAATARARVSVYDVRGALVRRLVDADLAPGRHEVAWDGRDTGDRAVPSGTYFARLEAGGVSQTRKLMLVR